MADAKSIEIRLSGGAANISAASSLGGAMSTAGGGIVVGQSFTWSSFSAFVSILRGAGNTVGTGTITYTSSDTSVTWTPPGGTAGPKVNINTVGSYILFDATVLQYIIIDRTAGALPVSNTSATVTVTDELNNVFGTITYAEALAGVTKQYRCVYIKNTHGSETMTSLRIWLEQDPTGPSAMVIGVDPAGAGGTATTIADETTDPTGVSFSAPTVDSPLTVGNLTAGQSAAIWFKRSIPAGSSGGRLLSPAKIGVIWS